MTRPKIPPCPGYMRHWFVYYGYPGSSAPTCRHGGCDVPNPRYDPERDLFADGIEGRPR